MAEIKRRETASGEVRWTLRVFLHRDPETGKRKFIIRTFETKGEAQREARKLEKMKDDGVVVEPTKDTLSVYLGRWLDAKEGEIRVRTIHDYRGVLRRYIIQPPEGIPPIGSIRLNRLSPDAFEQLYTYMRKDLGLAPRTIAYLHAILRQALGDAVRRKSLAANPTDYAKRPRRAKDNEDPEEKKAIRAMDKEAASLFLEAARADRNYALWTVLLLGGLRPSEALGLGWEHVDFDTSRVHVQRTLTRVGQQGWKLVARRRSAPDVLYRFPTRR